MNDLRRDISLFVSVARIEATVHAHRGALQRLPQEIAVIDRAIADLDAREKAAQAELEEMGKQRREAERRMREHEDHLKKCRNQQSLVKTNEEYHAMIKEIANLEQSIAADEEEILVLMVRIDEAQKSAANLADARRTERERRLEERRALEAKVADLTAQTDRLSTEKPKILSEISAPLLKRYERLSVHHRDLAVARVEAEHCGACHQQVPPQLAVEVRKNDQFITCPACGRILVDYAD